MATKTQVVLVDDLTGDPADTTVTFALDKTEYEIDLSTETSPWELRALRGAPEASGPATLLARLPDHNPDSTSGRPVTPALRSL
jgi:hypothetical protein